MTRSAGVPIRVVNSNLLQGLRLLPVARLLRAPTDADLRLEPADAERLDLGAGWLLTDGLDTCGLERWLHSRSRV